MRETHPSETSVSVIDYLCARLIVTVAIEHPMAFVWTKAEVDRFFCRSLVKPRRRMSVLVLCLPAVMRDNALVQKVSSAHSNAGIGTTCGLERERQTWLILMVVSSGTS